MIRMTWCSRARQQSAASGPFGKEIPSVAKAASVCDTARDDVAMSSASTLSSGRTGRKWWDGRSDETSRLRSLPKAETPSQSLLYGRVRVMEVPTSFSLAIRLPKSRNHQISISTSPLGKYFCHDISLLRNRHRDLTLTCSPRHTAIQRGAQGRQRNPELRSQGRARGDRNPFSLRVPGPVQCCDP